MTNMSTTTLIKTAESSSDPATRVSKLRALACRGLARMYRPDQKRFAFRICRTAAGLRLQGVSSRYTAMALLGLATEPDTAAEILHGHRLSEICNSLLRDVGELTDLGDVALTVWAAGVLQCDAEPATGHLKKLLTTAHRPSTVELAWALTALCVDPGSNQKSAWRERVAERLLTSFHEHSSLFPHSTDGHPSRLRGHVACFADQVYPIQALARYSLVAENAEALRVAGRCANRMCSLLGLDGQWWWHYDVRTGRVLERYPVYSVHQDAMAPMALFDLAEAGGPAHLAAIERGLAWLYSAPELEGDSLIDETADVIWRKVARREPRKFVRAAQAFTARIHPNFRCPSVDTLFPATVIDAECRPYHLGWLLFTWSPSRVAQLHISAGGTP